MTLAHRSRARPISYSRRPIAATVTGDAATGVRLRRLARIYWHRRSIITVIVVATLGLTFAVLQWIPPRYQSYATVMLDPRQHTVIDIAQVVAPFRPDELAVESEIQVMLSQDLARKVIAAVGLDASPEFNPAVERERQAIESAKEKGLVVTAIKAVQTWLSARLDDVRAALPSLADAAPITGPSPQTAHDIDNRRDELVMLQRFAAALDVRPVGRSRVIGVSFSARDPVLAATTANAVMEAYLAQQTSGRIGETDRANTWLRQRADELRTEAATAQQAYMNRLTAAQTTVGVDRELLRDQLLDINRNLVVAQAEHTAARKHREELESLLAAGNLVRLADIARSETIQAIRMQTVELERRLAEQYHRLGSRHPVVTALEAEIRSTRQSLESEARRLVADARSDEGAVENRLASLESTAKAHQDQLRQIQEATADISTLEREAKNSEDLYNTFLTRYKETSAGLLAPPEAWVVSRAQPGADPVFPNKPLILLFAGVASLGLAGAGVTLRELLQNGLRSTEEVEERFGLRGLGLSPALPGKVAGRGAVDYLLSRPRSAFAESVRIIVSNAIGPLRPETGGRVVSVCSACPHEGKSTLVAAAATLLAMSGFRVLVIDADMRLPSQHRLFGIPNHDGLSDFLNISPADGFAPIPMMPVPVVDESTGVHVLPGGQAGGSDRRRPVFLDHEAWLNHLIEHQRPSYDVILLDTPPCMAVADARLFGSLSDRCLFVTRWMATPLSKVRYALRELQGAGVKIAGVALLQVDVREHAGYEYGDSGLYHQNNRYYTQD